MLQNYVPVTEHYCALYFKADRRLFLYLSEMITDGMALELTAKADVMA